MRVGGRWFRGHILGRKWEIEGRGSEMGRRSKKCRGGKTGSKFALQVDWPKEKTGERVRLRRPGDQEGKGKEQKVKR